MTEADSSAIDRQLMKRLTIALLFLFLFTAAFTRLDRIYSQKFFDVTGEARWIWAQHRLAANEPVAFFATRDLDLPKQRFYTHIKVLGDPEYTLWFNGQEVAGRRVGEERTVALYDVSSLAKDGRNRIVIAVRARQGVGGLIASIDIAPETQNFVVTDASWKIYRRWQPSILLADVPELHPQTPMIIGEPPTGKWNYPDLVSRPSTPPAQHVLQPVDSFAIRALLPTIRTREGVAISVAEPIRATAFDFGFTEGRVRLTVDDDTAVSRVIPVRLANARDELDRAEWSVRHFVFAPGERSLTDPESGNFRYVLVYGADARAEVVR